jgi:aquaporin Z
VYAIGPITGCHINPAVTMGFVASGRMGVLEGISYWVAQATGGILGALALWGIFNESPVYSRSVTGLGADGYGKASMVHLSGWGAFPTEVVLTFIFVMVVLHVTSKVASAGFAGLAIGTGLTLVHLVGIPLTGTSVNPARSIGPALVARGEALSQLWLFIVAPLLGGLIAALAYRFLIQPEEKAAEDDRAAAAPSG